MISSASGSSISSSSPEPPPTLRVGGICLLSPTTTFAKVRDRETNKLVADRSTVIYNSRITLGGIPEAAYRYQLGSRSAVPRGTSRSAAPKT
jgi:hypothetical protein